MVDPAARCPCLSGLLYSGCCARLHRQEVVAQTAEQLMRSRYSAFATGDTAYLLATWHARTRPTSLELDDTRTWYRLDVISTRDGGPFDTTGVVEFEAFHRTPGPPRTTGSQREVSQFLREGREWFYVDGTSRRDPGHT